MWCRSIHVPWSTSVELDEVDPGGEKYLTVPEQTQLEQKIGAWSTGELIDAATYLLAGLKAAGCYTEFMDQTMGALHPVDRTFRDALQKSGGQET